MKQHRVCSIRSCRKAPGGGDFRTVGPILSVPLRARKRGRASFSTGRHHSFAPHPSPPGFARPRTAPRDGTSQQNHGLFGTGWGRKGAFKDRRGNRGGEAVAFGFRSASWNSAKKLLGALGGTGRALSRPAGRPSLHEAVGGGPAHIGDSRILLACATRTFTLYGLTMGGIAFLRF